MMAARRVHRHWINQQYHVVYPTKGKEADTRLRLLIQNLKKCECRKHKRQRSSRPGQGNLCYADVTPTTLPSYNAHGANLHGRI